MCNLTIIENIDDFFENKYKIYNRGYGIGGVGIISPLNNISIYNLNDYEKKSSQISEFIGSHEDSFSIVLGLMFGLIKIDDVTKFQPSSKIYQDNRKTLNSKVSKKGYLGRVISIYYANTKAENTISIKVPLCITPQMFQCLKDLYGLINLSRCRDILHICVEIKQPNMLHKYFDEDDEDNFLKTIQYLESHRSDRIRQFYIEGETIMNIDGKKFKNGERFSIQESPDDGQR